MRADDRAELDDPQLAQPGHPAAQPLGQRLRALGRVEVVYGDVDPVAARGGADRRATASSSSRAMAREAVRTFSTGTICPPETPRIGLIDRADPSRALAVPIRPPRRRCSRVST